MSVMEATALLQNRVAEAVAAGEERIRGLLVVRRDSYVWLIVIAIAIVIALGLMTAWFIYCRNQGGWPALDMPSWTSGGTWKVYCAS
ncbi:MULTISPECIES: hypothetical protein [unclassified Microbacterium]|uniref:hypothetical protein n=2 Tax=Microbacterium TaxID=33882 RepID=UPI001AC8AC2D|nr:MULTISPECIES: hypothetical protein [unclassified Microbacterium]MBN9156626.1 hypothetical protein [Microbacterium sp.]MBS1898119.1 hypothetical protein [Actinomycetota bacterium]MBS1899929.1 hypothetical protein [Actinomycetota bacterium]